VTLPASGPVYVGTSRVIYEVASLRAQHNLRTPDPIPAAAALNTGCTLFVTNDPHIRRVPGLVVAVLSEIAAA
jgi:predicted nucleic acid-binding protein